MPALPKPQPSARLAEALAALSLRFNGAKSEDPIGFELRLNLLAEDLADEPVDLILSAIERGVKRWPGLPYCAEVIKIADEIRAERMQARRIERLTAPEPKAEKNPAHDQANWRCKPSEVEATNALYARTGAILRFLPDGTPDPVTLANSPIAAPERIAPTETPTAEVYAEIRSSFRAQSASTELLQRTQSA